MTDRRREDVLEPERTLWHAAQAALLCGIAAGIDDFGPPRKEFRGVEGRPKEASCPDKKPAKPYAARVSVESVGRRRIELPTFALRM